MKGMMVVACALAVASAFAEFSPVDVSFARGKWNRDDFFVAKSWRFDYVGLFDQRDDAIVNHCPDGVSPEDIYKKHSNGVYSALVYKDMFDLGVTISSRMAWDWRMAPIIVIAPEMGKNADGVPEFRNHWEVCLYDSGINLWYHFFENGKQKWHKAAAILLPKRDHYARDTPHELVVRLARNGNGRKEITVLCGDFRFNHVDDTLPERFYAGIIGCEGRNFFYDFKVTAQKK